MVLSAVSMWGRVLDWELLPAEMGIAGVSGAWGPEGGRSQLSGLWLRGREGLRGSREEELAARKEVRVGLGLLWGLRGHSTLS